MPPLNWLIIGTGDIVQKRAAAAITSAEGSQLAGVCGERSRSEAIVREHGGSEVFDDIDTALSQTCASLVYVATPVYRHRVEAIKAMQAGKHVLIEKPLGLTAEDAQAMVDAAKTTNRIAGCAFYRRLAPRFAHARELLARGVLGQIVSVHIACAGNFNPAADDPKFWRVNPDLSGGGPLADMGCHLLDVMIALFGMPRSVYALIDTLVHDYDVEDVATLLMRLPDGGHVTSTHTWCTPTGPYAMDILGSEGRLTWSSYDAGEVTLTTDGHAQVVDLPPATNVHEPLVADFVGAVRDGRSPVCPLGAALMTNQLMDAAYASAATGEPVALPGRRV